MGALLVISNVVCAAVYIGRRRRRLVRKSGRRERDRNARKCSVVLLSLLLDVQMSSATDMAWRASFKSRSPPPSFRTDIRRWNENAELVLLPLYLSDRPHLRPSPATLKAELSENALEEHAGYRTSIRANACIVKTLLDLGRAGGFDHEAAYGNLSQMDREEIVLNALRGAMHEHGGESVVDRRSLLCPGIARSRS